MWRFIVDANTVVGPLDGVQLTVETWDGTNTVRRPVVPFSVSTTFNVDDTVRSVTLAFTHARYAPLAFVLARGDRETVWRWTNPLQIVSTAGQNVKVSVTMVRMKHADTTFRRETEIERIARDAKEPKDREAQQRRQTPPEAVRAASLKGALLMDKGQFYRGSGTPEVPNFHRLNADPLGDPAAAGWRRFSSTAMNVSPWKHGHVHLFEYGEVATETQAPRFLVSVWVPNQVADIGYPEIDLLVWLTPNTNLPNYPTVEYPFRGDYPYVLMAKDGLTRNAAKAYVPGPYHGHQTYATLGFAHTLGSHALAHQMIAAGRSAAIVVPIAPSAHFELWESPATLMRMLRDLARYIPRNDNDRIPKVHPKPPVLGRIGVAGFSAAGSRLSTLLNRPPAAQHYSDTVWGGAEDAAAFERAWGELWCIDGNFAANHDRFLEKVVAWVRTRDRHARIYKNDFTDGRWDPRSATSGEFARWVKSAAVTHREAGANWAVSCADNERRIQVVSVSKPYVVDPTSNDAPLLAGGGAGQTHENMPRVFFGHAAVTSGFRTMTY